MDVLSPFSVSPEQLFWRRSDRFHEEKEVNEIISPIHEDYCTIRRDMISEGIFRRDGSRYVRLK
ncbi:MAG: DUF2087 domain-containing protein [Oscillospiraceae bacterium]|nr:DUF2087 domain-containing protein [Oscillospiraceae bacterium]